MANRLMSSSANRALMLSLLLGLAATGAAHAEQANPLLTQTQPGIAKRCTSAAILALEALKSFPTSSEQRYDFVSKEIDVPATKALGQYAPNLANAIAALSVIETMNDPSIMLKDQKSRAWIMAYAAATCASLNSKSQ